MKFRKHTRYSVEHTPDPTPDNPEPEPVELELESEIDRWLEDELKVHRLPDGTFFLAYLCQEEGGLPDPLHDTDGMGLIGTCSRRDLQKYQEIYQQALGLDSEWRKRWSKNDLLEELAYQLDKDWRSLLVDDEAAFRERDNLKRCYRGKWDALLAEKQDYGELGNPDRVMLNVYEHGYRVYAVAGERTFPDEQWDVAHGGAVWVPDKALLEQAQDLKGDKRRAKMLEWARQAVELTNQWLQGEVFITELQHNDAEGNSLNAEWESCGGHFGLDYARQERDSQLKRAIKNWKPETQEAADA